jgi:hypothetical protein
MTDAELRRLVQDAVARHLGGRASTPAPRSAEREHPSHAQYLTVVNVGDACVIEPGVGCNHCGYCKSHGH